MVSRPTLCCYASKPL